jgi:sulfonate transport system substrate-binding protein
VTEKKESRRRPDDSQTRFSVGRRTLLTASAVITGGWLSAKSRAAASRLIASLRLIPWSAWPAVLAVCVAMGLTVSAARAQALPTVVPNGTSLTVADQNEELQTLMAASGEQAKLAAKITYANFLGGPAILEAFRGGALDLATVGNTPPIQAQAADVTILIVAARTSSRPDDKFAFRPGLKIFKLADFRGKRIAYAEGTARQPFVLAALKLAGLRKNDVVLVPLRVSDFPDAIRAGQVDIAPLNEPHYSRYLRDYADRGASGLPDSEYEQMPRGLSYLYASGAALDNPAKAAAIRDFVLHWIAANKWSRAHSDAWIRAYYVGKENLQEVDGRAIVASEGAFAFPPLRTLVERQQDLVNLIYEAGDIPRRLDAKKEFDLRFDEVIESKLN